MPDNLRNETNANSTTNTTPGSSAANPLPPGETVTRTTPPPLPSSSQPGELNRDTTSKDRDYTVAPDANRDPITSAPGAHPVGVGVGAAAAGTTGALIGSVAGPVGTAVGAVIGAVAGGLAGKGVAEAVNPTDEDAYWRDNYRNRPYYSATNSYEDDYYPAYRYGWESRTQHTGKKFDEVEGHLSSGWERAKGKSKLEWDKARHATRDAWDRVENKVSGRNQPGDENRYDH
jgi:hypothetical protein